RQITARTWVAVNADCSVQHRACTELQTDACLFECRAHRSDLPRSGTWATRRVCSAVASGQSHGCQITDVLPDLQHRTDVWIAAHQTGSRVAQNDALDGRDVCRRTAGADGVAAVRPLHQ